MIAVSTKVKKKKQKKSSKSKSGHMSSPPPLGSHIGGQETGVLKPGSEQRHSPRLDTEHGHPKRPDSDKTPTLKESASSSSSRLSLDSITEDGSAPMYVALATANQLVSGEAMAAASATAFVLSASSTSTLPPSSPSHLLAPSPSTSPSHLPPASEEQEILAIEGAMEDSPQSPNRSSSPADEMKTAMLTLSKMKDDLELQNRLVFHFDECASLVSPTHDRVLSSRVEELQDQIKLLHEELNSSRQELDSEKELQSSHKLALERENDLLREQLKKYVSIVQSQRSSSASESSGNYGVAYGLV